MKSQYIFNDHLKAHQGTLSEDFCCDYHFKKQNIWLKQDLSALQNLLPFKQHFFLKP